MTAEQQALIELWTSRLSCGHWTKPLGYGGVPYGRLRPGDWISCRRCQGQRKVVETLPWDELAKSGIVADRLS